METERAEMVERCATLAREKEGTVDGGGWVSLFRYSFPARLYMTALILFTICSVARAHVLP
jgi:hypothetical protein